MVVVDVDVVGGVHPYRRTLGIEQAIDFGFQQKGKLVEECFFFV